MVAPYEATSKEQLSLAKGQLVLVRKKTEKGWWQGEIQGVSISNPLIYINTYYIHDFVGEGQKARGWVVSRFLRQSIRR